MGIMISEIKKSFLKEPGKIFRLLVFFPKSFMREQLVAAV